jgi:hypothetical protein
MAEIYDKSMALAKELNTLANMLANLEPVLIGIKKIDADGIERTYYLTADQKQAYKNKLKAQWQKVLDGKTDLLALIS